VGMDWAEKRAPLVWEGLGREEKNDSVSIRYWANGL
jgi:hypothetical protein